MVEPERPSSEPEGIRHADGEEIRYPDGRIEHPHVRYEQRDASLGWILIIGISALALAVLIFYSVLWFFHDYKNYQATIKRSPFPLAPGPSEALPAQPHLEQLNRAVGIERSNVYERQAAKEDILRSYGPALGDLMVFGPSTVGLAASPGAGPISAVLPLLAGTTIPDKGVVRIPIGRAMALLKLSVRQEPPAGQQRRDNGLVDAGESNSGRMFREKPRWYER
jgi:hypothetical protein